MKPGDFMNQLDANLLSALTVLILIGAPVFGYFYNLLIDELDKRNGRHEHMSIYVAGGVLVTLVLVALLSWKAAVLAGMVFILTGGPMIVGEYKRTERKREEMKQTQPKIKRLPYKTNAFIDDAKIAAIGAHQYLGRVLSSSDNSNDQYRFIASASHELTTVVDKLNEVRKIQLEK